MTSESVTNFNIKALLWKTQLPATSEKLPIVLYFPGNLKIPREFLNLVDRLRALVGKLLKIKVQTSAALIRCETSESHFNPLSLCLFI